MNLSTPRLLLHLEGLAVLATATFLYTRFDHGWTLFFATFLVPDVALFGYLAGKRLGAALYNAVHTYTAPFLVFALLTASGRTQHLWMALVWSAHIGMDRLLGYGLKYESSAKDTHLGRV